MGRRGWGGSPPADDADARSRIVDAAIGMIERRGPAQATLSAVAAELGITRPTVYRHFATTEDLVTAAADAAVGGWTARIGTLTDGMTDPVEMLVEANAYLIEQLPQEPILALLLQTEGGSTISRNMVLSEAVARSRMMLEKTAIDWPGWDLTGSAMDDFVEYLLRMIHSMVIAPADPPRSSVALRAYLRQWIEPVLAHRRAAAIGKRVS